MPTTTRSGAEKTTVLERDPGFGALELGNRGVARPSVTLRGWRSGWSMRRWTALLAAAVSVKL